MSSLLVAVFVSLMPFHDGAPPPAGQEVEVRGWSGGVRQLSVLGVAAGYTPLARAIHYLARYHKNPVSRARALELADRKSVV